ncbi:MAG: ROK family protein [Candidatus Saccharimonadales bacterium]
MVPACATDGYLDPEFLDSEGGNTALSTTVNLSSGKSLPAVKPLLLAHGKRASDLDDPKAWDEIAKWFALGIVDLTAVLEPDVIIIGGGVGTHYKKYGGFLKKHIAELTPAVVDQPPIVPAKAAEQAVVYGCVILAKQYEQHR